MSRIILILFQTILWCGFNNDYSLLSIISGMLVATLIHFILFSKKREFRIHIPALFELVLFVIYELIISSFQVAYAIVSWRRQPNAGFLLINLKCKHTAQQSLLANVISLTPGTLSIDVNEHNQLIVHVMFLDDEETITKFISDQLEPRILRVMNYDSP